MHFLSIGLREFMIFFTAEEGEEKYRRKKENMLKVFIFPQSNDLGKSSCIFSGDFPWYLLCGKKNNE
jgi:hypothetical protein